VWNIDNINIKGAERISAAEIKEMARHSIKKEKNMIFFDTKSMEKDLNKEFKLEKLTIEKQWPNTLLIKITEEPYAYIWLENEKYYYSDINGFTLKKAAKDEYKPKEKKDLPLIVNKTNEEEKVKKDHINVDKDRIDFILDLYNEFDKNYSDDLDPEEFIIPSEANKVTVSLAQGPKVYFDSSGDPKEQLRNLLIVKTQKIKKDFKSKRYIDLRYKDQIYYQ
jgi:hypothetical protein